MERSHKGNDTNTEAIAIRRVRAIDLRVKGKLTIRQIALELGCSPQTIHNDLTAMVREEMEGVADLVKTNRVLETHSLDRLTAVCWAALDECDTVDDKMKVVARMTALAERRAKLLGLDTPVKQDIDVTVNSAPRTAANARQMMERLFSTQSAEPLPEDDELSS